MPPALAGPGLVSRAAAGEPAARPGLGLGGSSARPPLGTPRRATVPAATNIGASVRPTVRPVHATRSCGCFPSAAAVRPGPSGCRPATARMALGTRGSSAARHLCLGPHGPAPSPDAFLAPQTATRATATGMTATRAVTTRTTPTTASTTAARASAASADALTSEVSSPPAPGVPWTFEKLDLEDPLPDWYGSPPPAPASGRRAGVLLHPTSLPGEFGAGEVGDQALRWLDWLAAAGHGVWQVLPLCPPEEAFWSPYSSTDSLAGNPLLIPLKELGELGLLEPSELREAREAFAAAAAKQAREDAAGTAGRSNAAKDASPYPLRTTVDLTLVHAIKTPLLHKAARRLRTSETHDDSRAAIAHFASVTAPWAETSATFAALQAEPGLAGRPWWEWPEPLARREPEALGAFAHARREEIADAVALQWLFDQFWRRVRARAAARGVSIVGDAPIYVGAHSADVWASPHLFRLHPDGSPAEVSGVPPDAFSSTGQLWGSPLYAWREHRAEGYAWWRRRLDRCAQLYDETRIDHFRAFAGYWAVDGDAETAMGGSWRLGPGAGPLVGGDAPDAASAADPAAPGGGISILAEDLGVITPDVTALRKSLGAPGMAVLQFAFGGDSRNTHLPHCHGVDAFVYTGTHDNETTVGWWANAGDGVRRHVLSYAGVGGGGGGGDDASGKADGGSPAVRGPPDADPAGILRRLAYASVAGTAVVPMQDVLRLGEDARMNTPGRAEGNWRWRLGSDPGDVWPRLRAAAAELREVADAYDRLATVPAPESEDESGI